MLLTRFVERAVQLGLSRGEAALSRRRKLSHKGDHLTCRCEAMGVMSAIGAVGRMIAPQLFTRLWLRAVAQKGQPRALPLGAPMFAVALMAVIQAG